MPLGGHALLTIKTTIPTAGKTVQTVSFIHSLVEKQRAHGPYLVIAPLSTLMHWWVSNLKLDFSLVGPLLPSLLLSSPTN